MTFPQVGSITVAPTLLVAVRSVKGDRDGTVKVMPPAVLLTLVEGSDTAREKLRAVVNSQ